MAPLAGGRRRGRPPERVPAAEREQHELELEAEHEPRVEDRAAVEREVRVGGVADDRRPERAEQEPGAGRCRPEPEHDRHERCERGEVAERIRGRDELPGRRVAQGGREEEHVADEREPGRRDRRVRPDDGPPEAAERAQPADDAGKERGVRGETDRVRGGGPRPGGVLSGGRHGHDVADERQRHERGERAEEEPLPPGAAGGRHDEEDERDRERHHVRDGREGVGRPAAGRGQREHGDDERRPGAGGEQRRALEPASRAGGARARAPEKRPGLHHLTSIASSPERRST